MPKIIKSRKKSKRKRQRRQFDIFRSQKKKNKRHLLSVVHGS